MQGSSRMSHIPHHYLAFAIRSVNQFQPRYDKYSLRCHSLGWYPLEIIEPHISTENHVQVAVPRILAVMACKGITRPLIPVPGVGY